MKIKFNLMKTKKCGINIPDKLMEINKMAQTEIKNIEELAKTMAMPMVDSKHNYICDYKGTINGIENSCPYLDVDIELCLLFEEDLETSWKYEGRYKRCEQCLDNFVVKAN